MGAACTAASVLHTALEGLSEARHALALLARHAGEAARLGAATAKQMREPDFERMSSEYQALTRVTAQNYVALKVGCQHTCT